MRTLGYKMVPLLRLSLESGFRDRLELPRILERARSIERLGILHAPIVRKSDYRLISGHDRVAAAMKCALPEIECKLIECTDEELREIEITENAHRRHSVEEQRTSLMRLLEMYEQQAHDNKILEVMRNPQANGAMTPKGLARLRVAAELGIKPESVRMAERRKRHADEMAASRKQAKAQKEPVPPDIHSLGMELDEGFLKDVRNVHRALMRAHRFAVTILQSLTRLKESGLPVQPARMDRLYELVQGASQEIRAQLPVSVCPYCKGVDGYQQNCTACLGYGWISAQQQNSVPPALWQEGERAFIAHQGKLVTLASVMEGDPQGDAAVTEPELETEGAL